MMCNKVRVFHVVQDMLRLNRIFCWMGFFFNLSVCDNDFVSLSRGCIELAPNKFSLCGVRY